MTIGCYPGSFDPPTVAHLAIAAAALERCGLERLDLVVSRVALAKEHVVRPALDDRLAVLADVVAAAGGWLGLAVTDHQLLVDVARGYDVLVLGADKWAQVLDPTFYRGSTVARDAAVAALPAIAVAPRPGHEHVDLPLGATTLDVPADIATASSTVRPPRPGRVDGARGARLRPRHRGLDRSRPLRRLAPAGRRGQGRRRRIGCGGDEGNRTLDICLAKAALCQLSYVPGGAPS